MVNWFLLKCNIVLFQKRAGCCKFLEFHVCTLFLFSVVIIRCGKAVSLSFNCLCKVFVTFSDPVKEYYYVYYYDTEKV